ncbi:hypothetical protein [Oceanospirillum sediminis]|uniref:Uncharacterized protein n=1 Tax=Oceanospirillum sediminis TaxID=2760088 RepID=A0A839ILR8_9GAMM|nr:hypothetical protein [Oceanospirillum sediminis]MBB1485650.1 hypothetical protein [Oceanospirillum sediminis]
MTDGHDTLDHIFELLRDAESGLALLGGENTADSAEEFESSVDLLIRAVEHLFDDAYFMIEHKEEISERSADLFMRMNSLLDNAVKLKEEKMSVIVKLQKGRKVVNEYKKV